MKLQRLSPSRIKTFQQCQLQYHARYDLEVPERPPHPLTVMGKAVHTGAEQGTQRVMDGDDKVAFLDLVEADCQKRGVSSSNTRLALELMNNALSWGYLRNVNSCIGVEIKFDLELSDGTKVVGIFDRIDILDAFVDVIDLKTQKREFVDADLKSEWQSVIYNWASRKVFSDSPKDVRMSYWVLRHRVQRCWMTEDDAKQAEDAMLAVAEQIRSCTQPEPTPSALCQWCDYYDKCEAAHESIKKRFKRRLQ